MRKWMRERLQRRKKKTPDEAGKPAPPPLQPAYFDAEQAPPQASTAEAEAPVAREADPDSEPRRRERSVPEPVDQLPEPSSPAVVPAGGAAQRPRGRRRRGGR